MNIERLVDDLESFPTLVSLEKRSRKLESEARIIRGQVEASEAARALQEVEDQKMDEGPEKAAKLARHAQQRAAHTAILSSWDKRFRVRA